VEGAGNSAEICSAVQLWRQSATKEVRWGSRGAMHWAGKWLPLMEMEVLELRLSPAPAAQLQPVLDDSWFACNASML
jgi:hypothetical protein